MKDNSRLNSIQRPNNEAHNCKMVYHRKRGITYFSWFNCSSVSPKADLNTSTLSAMHSAARLLAFSSSEVVVLPVCQEERNLPSLMIAINRIITAPTWKD